MPKRSHCASAGLMLFAEANRLSALERHGGGRASGSPQQENGGTSTT
jgi:hypothetical protein